MQTPQGGGCGPLAARAGGTTPLGGGAAIFGPGWGKTKGHLPHLPGVGGYFSSIIHRRSHLSYQIYAQFPGNIIFRPFAFIDFDAVVESLRRKFNKAVLTFSGDEIKATDSFLSQNKPQVIQPKEIKLEMGKRRGKELLQSKFQQSR